ncbi:uncharacterized protein LOC141911234 [Tubulanus polymorphus]|uniref:uncharacterized protein LOC141911234 n=1 Tax=Tubulanus polymorphus TaxID=672921 RepID=UPI003DA3A83D
MKFPILLFVGVFGAVSGQTPPQCRSGWEYVSDSDKCIGFTTESCPSGTSPARIGSGEEDQAASSVLQNAGYMMANLGVTSDNLENGYSNWASDQPSPDGSQVFILLNEENLE